jgi:hypothetical protein
MGEGADADLDADVHAPGEARRSKAEAEVAPMIRDLAEFIAIVAFVAMVAIWSGFFSDHRQTCTAGDIASYLTDCVRQ